MIAVQIIAGLMIVAGVIGIVYTFVELVFGHNKIKKS